MVFRMTSQQNQQPQREPLRRTEIPLYVQLAGLVRRKIETGEWSAGERLPSLADLSDRFGIARVTVRQAVKILVREGFLVSRQGSGTFVTEEMLKRPSMNLQTAWTDLVHQVEGTSVRMLDEFDVKNPARLESEAWRTPPTCRYMRRVHAKDGRPYAVLDIYMDLKTYLLAPDRFAVHPVLPVLGSLSEVKVGSARQTLTIDMADTETARLLDLPVGSPVANVRRVVLDATGMAVYHGDVCYRGDYIKFEIDLQI